MIRRWPEDLETQRRKATAWEAMSNGSDRDERMTVGIGRMIVDLRKKMMALNQRGWVTMSELVRSSEKLSIGQGRRCMAGSMGRRC